MNLRGRKRRKELAATIERSRYLLVSEQHQENFELLEDAVQQYPDDADIRLLHAIILLEFRLKDVASEAKRAVELAPDEPRVLVCAASLLLNRGDRDTARTYVARANALVSPDSVLMGPLDNLNGLLAAFAGEDKLAEENRRSAVVREPANEPFVSDLAVFLAERGRLQDGVAVLDEGLKHVEKKDELESMRARMASEAAAS